MGKNSKVMVVSTELLFGEATYFEGFSQYEKDGPYYFYDIIMDSYEF